MAVFAGYPNERPDAAYMYFAGSILLQQCARQNLTKLTTRPLTSVHNDMRTSPGEKYVSREMENRETTTELAHIAAVLNAVKEKRKT